MGPVSFCLFSFCDNQPGGEVDAVAVGPVRGAAAGNVEHARDAPSLVGVLHLTFSSWMVVMVANLYLIVLPMDGSQGIRAFHSQGIPSLLLIS